MKKKILIPALLTITSLGILVGCDNNKTSQVEAAPKKAVDASMVVQGYEWGPAVPKVIVEFEDIVSGFDKTTFKVNTAGTNRTITDAYNSDKDGNKVTTPSKYVAFEMTVKYGMWAAEANPFTYDQTTGRNSWAQTYELKLTLASNKTFKVGDYQYGNENKWSVFKTNLAGKYTVPETAVWEKDTFKLENGQYTLQRASYTPTEAKTDSSKNPLVIWLHGAGEGGTDIDIDLLGNEVTALAKEPIQSYFTNDTQKGAYVLAIQTPTMWMDKGDGTYNHQSKQGGKQISCYTDTLWGAITDYVSKNDDVDTSRIYIGGCSNGGYMTMNMMFEHGDYFAAFYPICEAYMNANITDEMINQVKDYNIWFLHSQDDTTVDPRGTSIPTYYRLLKAGAKNVHYTLTQNVKGTDDPNATYMGHYSWIYAFNDQVKKEFDKDAVKNDIDNVTITDGKIDAKDKIYVDYTNCTKDSNMFTWMAAQNKAAVAPVSNGIKFEAEDGALTVADQVNGIQLK